MYATALLAVAVFLPAQTTNRAINAGLPTPIVFQTPDLEIFLIEESSDRLAWLATNRGIYAFDGAFFRKIPHSKSGEFSAVDAGQINDLFLDEEKGQLWVASQAGASVFDLKTETFTDHIFYRKESAGDTDGECTAIFKDRQDTLWFSVMGLGLVRYDTAFRFFPKRIISPGDFTGFFQIAADPAADSILWLAGGPTGLTRFNTATGTYFFPDRKPPEESQLSLILTAVFPVKDKIFLGSTWRNGCTIYDVRERRFRDLEVGGARFAGVDLKFGSFQPRSPTTIWGFSDGGMAVIDTEREALTDFFPYRYPAGTEHRNQCVRPNHIWVASTEGLLFYDFRRYTVENHRFPREPHKLGILTSVLEQEQGGRLWAAFQSSDFIYDYDRASRSFKTIRRHKKSRRDAPNTLLRLQDGRLIANGDGGAFELRDGKLTALDWLDELVFSKNIQLGRLSQSRDGSLWVNTRFGGFYKIDPNTGQYSDCLAGKQSHSMAGYFMDSRDNFWLSDNGFSFFNPRTDSLLHFPYLPGERLTSHHPRGYEEDGEGNIWLSDIRVGGLMKVDPRHLEKGIVQRFDAQTGSKNNLMRSLKKDPRGRIWAVTEGGLQVFDPKTSDFRLFGEAAGFQLRDEGNPLISNLTPSYLTLLSSGEMLVGYKDGFAIFHPDSLTENRELPKPYLLSMSANERKLTQGISFGAASPMKLAHRQNVLEFEFSSIAFYEPKKIRYRYRLLGFDKNWVETERRFLRYTHLPPGEYSFQLLALNSDGYHAKQPLEWQFRILPPWWATWWAYLAYLSLAVTAAYAFYFYKKRRWQIQSQLEMEHREAERLKELDSVKTKLYTNITHEFRTPLTVILGMVKQIKDNPKDWYSEGLQMIERNGRSLLRLVNQMLDLSKLEAGAMPVHLVQGDVVAFLKYLLESFHSLAAEKGITLQFHSGREALVMDYDPDKVQKIVSNLLSNAVKFTPEGGQVVARLSRAGSGTPGSGEPGYLCLSVSDTGPGIPPDKLSFVFDRFYQADGEATRKAEGAGIGLALTKELVKLLGGEISVKSEIGQGTEFVVRLPVKQSPPPLTPKGEPYLPHPAENFEKISSVLPDLGPPLGVRGPSHEGNNPTIQQSSNPTIQQSNNLLIVEDNPDVVRYLQSILLESYRIEVAPDGRSGIEKAIETVPDIIISDVMMPEADGYELCETLKKDERTSHIPIILLTAKADAASRLEGLECGADAYLAKPFDKEELLVRLRKMVELRKTLQQRYANGMKKVLPLDRRFRAEDEFMKKLLEILEDRYADETFDVPELCQALCMSRAQCYRKITALTGKPAAHLLRTFRLQKAKALLATSALNISQVALEVGFKDLAHFSRSFHQEFGVSPSEIRK